jgi:tetratricopeptide (TPR) repeat protein
MQRIILLLSLFFISLPIIPCGNSYRPPEDLDAYYSTNSLSTFRFREKFDQSALMKELQILGDEIKKGFNIFQDENDRALTFMRVGEYKKALEILQRLEKEKPDEYNIVANLGTLYELTGENEKALAYIKKAVKLDDQSHHGSEWFHIQVLEAKLSGKNNDWWQTHRVLDLSSPGKEPETMMSDITYQLKERIPFTPKPDIMMASILDQSGDYFKDHSKEQHAWILYKIAAMYDKDSSFPHRAKLLTLEDHFAKNNTRIPDLSWHYMKKSDLLEEGEDLLDRGIDYLKRENEKIAEKEKKKKNTNTLLLAGAGVIIITLIAFLSLRKK